MDSIVERLLRHADIGDMGRKPEPDDVFRVAAAKIQSLQADNAALREAGLMALAAIDDHNSLYWVTGRSHIGDYVPIVRSGAKVKSLSEARALLERNKP